ncbi:hypothetical protein M433DRAFT_233907 [Acidomyces richmondensis BFW]|nr:MAG: hypothetical protein FE78DRAFT_378361 [Acidomyces sp. 'richmondensis']KYG45881.1 hypothetical protein M433DRAFT_233907 [Acidomyces richmondensis BFW]
MICAPPLVAAATSSSFCASVTGTQTHEPKLEQVVVPSSAGRNSLPGRTLLWLTAWLPGPAESVCQTRTRDGLHAGLFFAFHHTAAPLYQWSRPAHPSLQYSPSTPSLRSHRSSVSRAFVSYQLPPVLLCCPCSPRSRPGMKAGARTRL